MFIPKACAEVPTMNMKRPIHHKPLSPSLHPAGAAGGENGMGVDGGGVAGAVPSTERPNGRAGGGTYGGGGAKLAAMVAAAHEGLGRRP
jgi:hypothetical protein|tara:strand:- start:215 stop:481 length:267 start_codon:yes stop_codon:yes gene_type:complete